MVIEIELWRAFSFRTPSINNTVMKFSYSSNTFFWFFYSLGWHYYWLFYVIFRLLKVCKKNYPQSYIIFNYIIIIFFYVFRDFIVLNQIWLILFNLQGWIYGEYIGANKSYYQFYRLDFNFRYMEYLLDLHCQS